MGSDMNELEKLQADLLTLPANSRASLARALIESLDEATDENSGALWVDEIRRRDEELQSGRASARPVDDVLRDARERLRCMK
jgi:putative addiction module component (TIGR02574 family)